MAQHEHLGTFGTLAPAPQHQQVDHKSDETVETGHVWILIDPSRADQIETAKPHVKTPDKFSAPTGSLPRVRALARRGVAACSRRDRSSGVGEVIELGEDEVDGLLRGHGVAPCECGGVAFGAEVVP